MKPLLLLLASLSLPAQTGGVVFHAEARMVEVYATVLDRRGKYVDDLDRAAFTVLDNGAPQPISTFENGATQLSCAILLDTTGSMMAALPKVKNATRALIGEFRENDWIAVYGFSTGVEILQDFTRDQAAARNAVSRTRAEGGTALFDAIAHVAREVSPRNGKKFMVVFTDGDDNSSMLNVRAAIERAKKAGVPLYVAAEGEALRKPQLLEELKELATLTGGRVYTVKNLSSVEAIFHDICEELQHTYLLAYNPPKAPSGEWRKIEIAVKGVRDHKVQARTGYISY